MWPPLSLRKTETQAGQKCVRVDVKRKRRVDRGQCLPDRFTFNRMIVHDNIPIRERNKPQEDKLFGAYEELSNMAEYANTRRCSCCLRWFRRSSHLGWWLVSGPRAVRQSGRCRKGLNTSKSWATRLDPTQRHVVGGGSCYLIPQKCPIERIVSEKDYFRT